MKTLSRNITATDYTTTDCTLVDFNGKKVKMQYEVANAYERFNALLFDGDKFNPLFSAADLGFQTNRSTYVQSQEVRKQRADELIKKATAQLELLFS